MNWKLIICVTVLFVELSSSSVFPNFRANYEFVPIENLLNSNAPVRDGKWWHTASFYQIYPRSFKDSNGDGIGDLRGIAEKLPYLKEIGITATWLSPIFKSPMADFGYDIANFTQIDPIFGTLEDLEALIAVAKRLGIKIILDFVPNHSSDECEWFQKSIARDPEFENFYVWHPGKLINGTRHPPTNWMSVFRGSAWTWNEQRKEYYLHQFLDKQPDFNYRDPKVKQYLKKILRFWLKKGVDGFRVDAVPFIYEVAPDSQGNYPDEPHNSWVTDPDDYNSVQHIYTAEQPETIEMVYEWRKIMDEFTAEYGGDDRVLLIEAYAPVDYVMKFYGNATVEGAQIPFNFFMISWLTNDSDAYFYAETINTWLQKMPKGRTPNWVLGNHDQKRVGSRLGADRIDMLNMLLLTLPGCSITYQGEEIGMTDVWISWKQTIDPQACNSNPEIYEHLSRDPARTPFQWNDEHLAGFTNGSTTWLPISDLYPLVNVKRERGIPYSYLNIFKQLQNLRSEKVIKYGDSEVKAISNTVLAVKRSLKNEYTYITVLNIMNSVENVNLNAVFEGLTNDLEYVVVTKRSLRRKGDKTFADQIILLPKEAVVFRTTSKQNGYYRYNHA